MLNVIEIALGVAALYSAVTYLVLGFLSITRRVDYERETFHLGLCFILAAGLLGLILVQGG